MKCFLRQGSDYLEDAEPHNSIGDAKAAFLETATELAGYGQVHEASIHIADSIEEVVEYPDYVLSLGPRGGLKFERA